MNVSIIDNRIISIIETDLGRKLSQTEVLGLLLDLEALSVSTIADVLHGKRHAYRLSLKAVEAIRQTVNANIVGAEPQ